MGVCNMGGRAIRSEKRRDYSNAEFKGDVEAAEVKTKHESKLSMCSTHSAWYVDTTMSVCCTCLASRQGFPPFSLLFY